MNHSCPYCDAINRIEHNNPRYRCLSCDRMIENPNYLLSLTRNPSWVARVSFALFIVVFLIVYLVMLWNTLSRP